MKDTPKEHIRRGVKAKPAHAAPSAKREVESLVAKAIALQAAREARPSEADLQCWEQSARNGLTYGTNPRAARECHAYLIACRLVRATDGLSINDALLIAFAGLEAALELVDLPTALKRAQA